MHQYEHIVRMPVNHKNEQSVRILKQPFFYNRRVEHKLKEIRESLKLTQTELADKADTSLRMVQYLENGDRQFTPKWAERFSKALNIPTYAFFYDAKTILNEFDRELVSRYHSAPENIKNKIKKHLDMKDEQS